MKVVDKPINQLTVPLVKCRQNYTFLQNKFSVGWRLKKTTFTALTLVLLAASYSADVQELILEVRHILSL